MYTPIQPMEYVSPRSNVYHAIKYQVREIRASFNKAREELGRDYLRLPNATAKRATQTFPPTLLHRGLVETRLQKIASQPRQPTKASQRMRWRSSLASASTKVNKEGSSTKAYVNDGIKGC